MEPAWNQLVAAAVLPGAAGGWFASSWDAHPPRRLMTRAEGPVVNSFITVILDRGHQLGAQVPTP